MRMAARPVHMPQKRRSKYGATPTTVDGIRFHSAREARRYGELKLLEQAGRICNLVCQPRFSLMVQPVQQNQDPIKVGEYVADFAYEEGRDWDTVIEDVKGVATPLYKWKKKHVEAQYGITVKEIR